MRLTEAKKRVYDAIKAFWKRHGYSPTLEEIAEATGVSSLAPVSKHVNDLVHGGYLTKTQNGSRRTLIPLPLGKGDWQACDERHRIVLYQGPMCPVCHEKQARDVVMARVNGAKR